MKIKIIVEKRYCVQLNGTNVGRFNTRAEAEAEALEFRAAGLIAKASQKTDRFETGNVIDLSKRING